MTVWAAFVFVLNLLQAAPGAARVPCVVPATPEQRTALDNAGVKRLCADGTTAAGREAAGPPGVSPRPGVASPTRAPWIVANGWRFLREPGKTWTYDVSAAKAPLAAAEAFAYGADAVLRIDPADTGDSRPLGEMLAFLDGVPPSALAGIADFAVVDDGSAVTAEAMNLLARRNLLFEIVKAPSAKYRLNVTIGSPEFPKEEAADPSAFAMKIRRQLGDEQRTLRVFGSEVVICRLTGDAGGVRLHLLNYGARDIEGLRIRLRGMYQNGDALVAGAGRVTLADFAAADGATEFSLPRLSTYAVIDLKAAR
jgi:hypothetical protein